MRDKTKFKRRALSTLLVLGLLFTNLRPLGALASEAGTEAVTETIVADAGSAAADAPKELTWNNNYLIDRSVSQEGKTIQASSKAAVTGVINPNASFRIETEVALPVGAKTPSSPFLKKNDFLRIPIIDNGANLVGGIDLGKIPAKFIVNGNKRTVENAFSAKFEKGTDNKLYLVMTLLVDNSELVGATELTAKIITDLTVDYDTVKPDGDKYVVNSNGYKIPISTFNLSYTMEKTGTIDFDKGNIDWTIPIKIRGQLGETASLAKYKFDDPIT